MLFVSSLLLSLLSLSEAHHTYANCLDYRGNLAKVYNESECVSQPRNVKYQEYSMKTTSVCQSLKSPNSPLESLYSKNYQFPTFTVNQNVTITWPNLYTNYGPYQTVDVFMVCNTGANDANSTYFLSQKVGNLSYAKNCVASVSMCSGTFVIPQVASEQNCTFLWKADYWTTCFDAVVVPPVEEVFAPVVVTSNAGSIVGAIFGVLLGLGVVFFAFKKREAIREKIGEMNFTKPEIFNNLTMPTWTSKQTTQHVETPIEYMDAGKIEANYIKPVAPASTSHGHFGRVREPVKVTHYGRDAPVLLNMS